MYRNDHIYSINLTDYAEYIPETYCAQIRRGELNAVAVYDKVDDSDILFGVYVTAKHNGWLEVVWLYYANKDMGEMARADLLRYCIRTERIAAKGELKGAFMEVHMDEDGEKQKRIFELAGMECRREKNNIYEFRLSQVGQRETFNKVKKRLECRSLCDCDEEELDGLDARMQEDERITPVPLFMDWYEYIQDISQICFKGGEAVGALLFTAAEDYLVLELAYTSDNMALPVMLGNALDIALQQYGGDKKVLVPIVVHKTGEIVEKIVPDAYRGEIIEGAVWYKN